MSTAAGSGSAHDAHVVTDAEVNDLAYRRQLADEAEQNVKTIKAQIRGLERTLRDTEREAKRLRAEAKE